MDKIERTKCKQTAAKCTQTAVNVNKQHQHVNKQLEIEQKCKQTTENHRTK